MKLWMPHVLEVVTLLDFVQVLIATMGEGDNAARDSEMPDHYADLSE